MLIHYQKNKESKDKMEDTQNSIKKISFSGRISTLMDVLSHYSSSPEMTVEEMFEKEWPARFNCLKRNSQDNRYIAVKEIYTAI